jgi:hypothetical protein
MGQASVNETLKRKEKFKTRRRDILSDDILSKTTVAIIGGG